MGTSGQRKTASQHPGLRTLFCFSATSTSHQASTSPSSPRALVAAAGGAENGARWSSSRVRRTTRDATSRMWAICGVGRAARWTTLCERISAAEMHEHQVMERKDSSRGWLEVGRLGPGARAGEATATGGVWSRLRVPCLRGASVRLQNSCSISIAHYIYRSFFSSAAAHDLCNLHTPMTRNTPHHE